MALENNLGLQVERLDPALARERVREYEGRIRAESGRGLRPEHVETPIASAVQTFARRGLTDNTVDEDYFTTTPEWRASCRGASRTAAVISMQQPPLRLEPVRAGSPQYTATWKSER